MQDIAMLKRGDLYDIAFDAGDIKTIEGLETAAVLSLFTDARADKSETAKTTRRRGWLGNATMFTDGHEIGSKLWLLEQARLTDETEKNLQTYVSNCFAWMLKDRLIRSFEVTTGKENQQATFNVKFVITENFVTSINFALWNNTNFEVLT